MASLLRAFAYAIYKKNIQNGPSFQVPLRGPGMTALREIDLVKPYAIALRRT